MVVLLRVRHARQPKSHTLRSQLPLSSRFDGLRSRWSTCALWMYLSARRIWYRKYWQWSSVSGCGDEMIWWRSVSIRSHTMYTSSKRSGETGSRMSLIRITFSWLKWRRILISRSVRLVSVRWTNALLIFLIATFSPLSLSFAEHTTPYAPWRSASSACTRPTRHRPCAADHEGRDLRAAEGGRLPGVRHLGVRHLGVEIRGRRERRRGGEREAELELPVRFRARARTSSQMARTAVLLLVGSLVAANCVQLTRRACLAAAITAAPPLVAAAAEPTGPTGGVRRGVPASGGWRARRSCPPADQDAKGGRQGALWRRLSGR